MFVFSFYVTKGLFRRRSTIEVHPKFTENPHLRNSTPHPKTDASINEMESRWITLAQVYNFVTFCNKIGIFDDFGLRNPVTQKPF